MVTARATFALIAYCYVGAFAAPPNLAGAWQHRGGGEQYSVVATPNSLVYNATCLPGVGCTTWTKSTVTITNPDTRAAIIVFTGEGGRNHTGVFDADWAGVLWADNSAWERKPSPQPIAPGVTSIEVIVM